MKRKIMAVLTATVVAFGGVVVAAAPAQAASCSAYLHPGANTPGYALVTNYTCGGAKAGMTYQNPATGTKYTTWPTLWAGPGQNSKTGTVNSSWVTNRLLAIA